MRILLLSHAFNSLTQRLYAELAGAGHEVSVELDINDAVTVEAARLWRPELVIAPFLKRAIPEALWRELPCLVVHPGPPGDRGPSALDWAIQDGEDSWGLTVLQAEAELDAGPVWAWRRFPLRAARKSSVYRHEVTEAAVAAVFEALGRYTAGGAGPTPAAFVAGARLGRPRPQMKQSARRIDWLEDGTADVLRKLHAADGDPGVKDVLCGLRVSLFDARPEPILNGAPGTIIARSDEAVCIATRDGAVWIGRLREAVTGRRTLKLPATRVLAGKLHAVPYAEPRTDSWGVADGLDDIRYVERGAIGFLHFDFYNGAMGADRCRRLLDAYRRARERPTRVIVLMGGADFWCNGIDLNLIEAAASPADESWRSINAMDDLAREIILTDSHLTVAALGGNAAAGGLFLALAADRVYARDGVILNPHYKNMGNLYGSEYWTYLLPRRLGIEGVRGVMEHRLPLRAMDAAALGLVDGCLGNDPQEFGQELTSHASELAYDVNWSPLLAAKRARRAADEARQPLQAYREAELERMRLNFYGFDPSYHVARYRFVYRQPHAWTPLHLARHRQRPAPIRSAG